MAMSPCRVLPIIRTPPMVLNIFNMDVAPLVSQHSHPAKGVLERGPIYPFHDLID